SCRIFSIGHNTPRK
ncbi:putative conserved membrane protein, partial [Chlamydia psittaci C1/97]